MEETNCDYGAATAQETASRAAEVADHGAQPATPPGDRCWLEDLANAIRALSPATDSASVEKMLEDLARAVQTNHSFLLSGTRKSAGKKSFLLELRALQRLIDPQFGSNSAWIPAPSSGRRPKNQNRAKSSRRRPRQDPKPPVLV